MYKCIITIIYFTFMCTPLNLYIIKEDCKKISPFTIRNHKVIKEDKDTLDIRILIKALMSVESGFNEKAISKDTKDRGILQLRDVYIDDVNRILKQDKYTYNDAFSIEKSIEMFMIYQNHYNPKKHLIKAITLHNPRGGKEYINKVMEKYELFKQHGI